MRTSGRRQGGRARAEPRLRLDVQFASAADGIPVRATLRRWLLRSLERDAEIVLRFVGSAEGRRLNSDFRNRDYATNVLTFVYQEDPAAAGTGPPLAGDIVLCVPVLQREARASAITLRAHCAHLVIHGALHLQGHDHQSDKDARVMEALETAARVARVRRSVPGARMIRVSMQRCRLRPPRHYSSASRSAWMTPLP